MSESLDAEPSSAVANSAQTRQLTASVNNNQSSSCSCWWDEMLHSSSDLAIIDQVIIVVVVFVVIVVLVLSRSFVSGWPPTWKTWKSHGIWERSRKCRKSGKVAENVFSCGVLRCVCMSRDGHNLIGNSDFVRPRTQQNVIMCRSVRTVRLKMFPAQISNCTNLFRLEPNRARRRIFAFVRLLFCNLWKSKCSTDTHMWFAQEYSYHAGGTCYNYICIYIYI